jgi:hypothetical protein
MANASAVRDPQQCQEKQALIDEIRILVRLIVSIHNEELDAAMVGDCGTGDRYAAQLHEAQYRKTLFVEMLGRHVNDHGC